MFDRGRPDRQNIIPLKRFSASFVSRKPNWESSVPNFGGKFSVVEFFNKIGY